MSVSREDAKKSGLARLLPPDHPWHEPAGGAGAKRSKYRAVATTYRGVRYASKAEANRAEALDDLRGRGLIRWWIGQPTFRLGCPENVYRADALVIGNGGEVWCEDVKGQELPKFRRDKRLWAKYGPCPLHILKRGKTAEIIDPKRIKEQGIDIDENYTL